MPRTSLHIHNPLLALPAAEALLALPAELRAPLAQLLRALSADASYRAEDSWRRKKGPMAVYWKAVSVYAKHTARVLSREAAPAAEVV